MATDIHIKNFQSIKDLQIRVEGFTVLIGKNNIGKSAIIRAVKSALDNESGKGNIRLGESTAEVRITRPDINFKWSKGVETSYEVMTSEKGKEIYTKLNGAVPEPIIKAGFDKIIIDDKQENPLIANQFKTLFLLDKRGSVITEVLTDLYDIDIITIADEKCQKDLKSNKSQLKVREDNLKTLLLNIAKYQPIEDIKKSLKDLSDKEKEKSQLEDEINSIIIYEQELEKIEKTISRLKPIKSVITPDYGLTEVLMTELLWLIEKDTELKETSTNFKRLKGVNELNIPVLDDRLSIEIEWIKNKDQEFLNLQKSVKNLQRISSIVVPEIGMTEKAKDELSLLTAWVTDIEYLNKKLKIIIPDIYPMENLFNIIDIKIKELTLFIEEENVFVNIAKSAKLTKEELKSIQEILLEKKKEIDNLKMCPFCERPL